MKWILMFISFQSLEWADRSSNKTPRLISLNNTRQGYTVRNAFHCDSYAIIESEMFVFTFEVFLFFKNSLIKKRVKDEMNKL